MGKVRSTIMVSEEVFKNMRYYAMRRGQDISEFTEEALSEKIAQCKEEDKIHEEVRELRATVEVARKLYQQMKRKPDFSTVMSGDFIKTITSGVDPKYHDFVANAITEEDESKVQRSLVKEAYEIAAEKPEQSKPQPQHREQSQPQRNRESHKGDEPQLLDQGAHFRMFQIVDPEKSMRKSKSGEKLVDIELYMPGITFPLDQKTVLDYAEREFLDRDAFLLNVFQSLNAKEYRTQESLENALTQLFNTVRKDFFGKRQTVDRFTIYTTKEELPVKKENMVNTSDKKK
jgi:hypothetical protein